MAHTRTEPKVTFDVDGKAIVVHRVDGTIAVSELFSIKVLGHETDLVTAAERLGKPGMLVVQPVVGPPLTIHGILTSVESRTDREADGEVHHHVFELRPAVAALTVGRDHRYFQNLDVVAIVKKVLELAGVDAALVVWKTDGTYRKRDYTTQWGESDWTFIERLLREEGLAYCFDFGESETKLVVFDDSVTAPEVEGGSILCVRESGMETDAEAVFNLKVRWATTPDQVILRDYNPVKPTVNQEAKVDTGTTKASRYDYPGRYGVPADGTGLAKRRLESLAARRCVLQGATNNPRLWPGRKVTIDESRFEALSSAFVTGLSLTVLFAHAEGQGRANFSFSAVPGSVPFRPPTNEDGAPTTSGPQTAQVVGPRGEELHTDESGRVRAQFHWDRLGKGDETSSTFMRVGQFALGGSMVRPRIGWDVLVEHHSGDADVPMLLSHLYDGEHPVPYALPANKTRSSWQTATTPGNGSSNEIRFEDKKGSEEIFINASKDMAVAIGDTKSKQVGNNHSHDIGSNSTITSGAERTIGVTTDQKFEVGAAETLSVSGGRSTGIGGSDTVTIGAARSVTVSSGTSIEATGGRSLTVGGSMIAVAGLGVSRAVLGSASVTVGGAWISAAATGLGNVTAGAGAETIGGAKLQIGVGGVTLGVKGALAETVGAAYVSAAGGNFGESATGAISITVGGAFIMNSPSIEIEAESEIKIVCGGTSLTITGSCIELKSPAVPQPAAMIASDGATIHHNP